MFVRHVHKLVCSCERAAIKFTHLERSVNRRKGTMLERRPYGVMHSFSHASYQSLPDPPSPIVLCTSHWQAVGCDHFEDMSLRADIACVV